MSDKIDQKLILSNELGKLEEVELDSLVTKELEAFGWDEEVFLAYTCFLSPGT